MASLALILQHAELFTDLSPEMIQQEIIPLGHLQEYQKGQFLIEPQQKIGQFGIILSGKVHILHIFADGTQSLMSDVTTGEIVGADLVCTRSQISPYHAMAAATTQVFYLPILVLARPGMLNETVRLSCLGHMLTLISNENNSSSYSFFRMLNHLCKEL